MKFSKKIICSVMAVLIAVSAVAVSGVSASAASVKAPKTVKVNEEVALKWLANGAIPSDTVRNLLSEAGVMKKFHESKKGN